MRSRADVAVLSRRRRRHLRLSALTLALIAIVALLAGVAAGAASAATVRAASAEVVLKRGDRGSAVKRLQRRLRISADGAFGRQTERAVKRFQRRRGLPPDGIVGQLARRALGLPGFSRRSVNRSRRTGRSHRVPAILRAIARCESGVNPRAVSRDGRYRGKYQFLRSTWRSLGGDGDPAQASERLQDRLALKLYRLRGVAAWGNCAAGAARRR